MDRTDPSIVEPVARLGRTDLDVHPLCLGGNVFGWTADEETSFAVLDDYAAAGGNFVDTADAYSAWVPGHQGGESETVIGRWMAARGNREQMVVATKVGRLEGLKDLRADTIRKAAEDSLRRLQTDRIDLYYAHGDDNPEIPLEETLGAFDELVRAGKVRYIAASNYGVPRLSEALKVSRRDGLAEYVALQPHYNLVERDYEDGLAALCAKEGLACVPYFSLAMGFLTGKYRPGGPDVGSPRAGGASKYLDDRGVAVLEALDDVAAAHGTSPAAAALAWLGEQPTVAAPIASARTPEQLAELLPMADLKLSRDELDRLTAAGTE
jgi:aryl-alcohol dehydrogenase-like predicted oxidoreductase